MSTDSQEQKLGLIREYSFDDVGFEHPWNMSVQPNTIMGGFQTPGAAFYATERCMGFPCNSFHAIQPNYESISKSHISWGKSYTIPCTNTQTHHLSFFQQEKQSSNYSSGTTASKTRIRWTQDLHDKFVECIKRLGGAEKATPKAILKLMDTQGLTIFHVKSHLQKYRIAKYMPDSAQGKSQRATSTSDVTQIDVKTGLHLTETLHLQLDVQRRLHEQLEIQRNLQLRIEEQGRQLKMMIDQQQKTSESLLKKQDHDISPSFSFEDVEASIAES
ncbi:hypothetical protein HRI_000141300 [Hibiscus trionum]|uniref:HTH myb-type domain-containing protein n=1 Tax=Hibiscus trionum TaxID=183268 RepID=A0A9W7GVJ4_HIBTR|nr:hypothetical protein HRI_000141300 [Hibiscus trionum]